MSDFRADSYKFLPRSMQEEFRAFPDQPSAPAIARVTVRLREAKVALLTSAGIYLKDSQPPFDIERERREPLWGDPTYRVIPRKVRRDQVGVAHLHLNSDDLLADFNVALPLDVFAELERSGKIGSLAKNNYSFMGYQGASNSAWGDQYGPELARRLNAEAVNLVVLAPT